MKEVFNMPKMVMVPDSLLKKFLRATQSFEDLGEELEDFLLTTDAEFIRKMRQARSSHLNRKTRPLSALKKELCIK
jgi:hypothetical protein